MVEQEVLHLLETNDPADIVDHVVINRCGNGRAMKAMLDHGLDPNHKVGGHPLIWFYKAEIIRILVNYGADINLINTTGHTLLQAAYLNCNFDLYLASSRR